MAEAVIKTVRDQAITLLEGILGDEFKLLPHQFDVSMNDDRNLAAGFSVTWQGGTQPFEIAQKVNIRQELLVTFTRRVHVRNNDSKIVDRLSDLYPAIEETIRTFCVAKLERPDIIREVRLRNLGAPDLLGEGRDIVAVPLTFDVSYLLI